MDASWEAAGAAAAAEEAKISPLDGHNVLLLDRVFPKGYENPSRPEGFVYDLVAVGAGAAGLVAAKQSARRGGTSALIESHLAGGDCLNVGCVPSKALLRCARSAAERRRSDLGVAADATPVDFGKVMERMRALRSKIAAVDSVEATLGAGADAYIGKGVFVGPNAIEVAGRTLRFKKAVICTGGRASLPPIPGLKESSYLTHVELFNLTELPARFCVIGGGPIGLEMAQAFARFGSQVTLLEAAPRILMPEDPAAAAIVQQALEEDGVRVIADAQIKDIQDVEEGQQIKIRCTPGGGEAQEVICDKLLVAAGRVANVEDMGLDAAGVEYRLGLGIKTNDDLSTSNPDIFAAGDCTQNVAFRFTHTAGCMASVVVTNAIFGGRGPPSIAPSCKLSEIVVPRCTFTEPEVASCGIANLQQAERAGIEVDEYMSGLEHNDRVILEGDRHGGFVKILCEKGTDKIVGGVIVAERAGDMLAEVTLAAQHGLGIAALGHTVHPYPTSGEGVQQCALGYIREHWERLDAPAPASTEQAPEALAPTPAEEAVAKAS